MVMKQWLKSLRDDFHSHPELSESEHQTTRKICSILQELDVAVQTFDGITGAVGLIKGMSSEGPNMGTIALRADIDALPIQELTELPQKSLTDGVMHACGHDANTTIALGVAKKVKESGLIKKINGQIKFIFQPSEEKLGGALSMIEKGVLENPKVDRIIAGHMDPNLPVGEVGVFKRVGHAASDPFVLNITGRGSHGARPHKGRSPITAGAHFVANLDQIIPRHIPPVHSAVISVGAFHGGNAGNVIPAEAQIKGSIRSHDLEVREILLDEMRRLAVAIEMMFEVDCNLQINPGAPLGLNDEATSCSLRDASIDILGKEKVRELPFIMGSDDFYYFTQKCPGAMMRLGCADIASGITHPLHSPYFNLHEDVLETGVDVMYRVVERFFT